MVWFIICRLEFHTNFAFLFALYVYIFIKKIISDIVSVPYSIFAF